MVIWLVVFFVAGANGLIQVGEVTDGIVGNETWGAGAAVFALATALFLFITTLPKNKTVQDATVDTLTHAFGVVTAFCAGLLWLLDETEGSPGGYLIVLVTVSGLLAFMLAIIIMVDWLKQRRRNKRR